MAKNRDKNKVDNVSQEVLDFIGSRLKSRLNIGSAIGLVQSSLNNEPLNLSDSIGLIPSGLTQLLSLTALQAEAEKENIKNFQSNSNKGKKVITNFTESNTRDIESTYVSNKNINMKKNKVVRKYGIGTGTTGVITDPIVEPTKEALLNKIKATAVNSDKAFNTKKIVNYQPGVSNDKMGSGFYLYSKNVSDPGFDVTRDREFVKQAEMMAVQKTPEWKEYMATQKFANGTGASGVTAKNYIQSPSEALAENDILMAKAEADASDNPWAIGVQMAGQIGSAMAKSFGGPKAATETVDATGGIPSTLLAPGIQGPLRIDGTYALGGDNASGQIEAEGGEVVETPGGEPAELKGPKHTQGGIDMNVPEGTKIYSDQLKGADGKTMADRKKARERKELKLDELLATNKGDKAIANSHKRMRAALDMEEQNDLQMQEMATQFTQMQEFAMGTGEQGVKMALGGVTGPGFPLPFSKSDLLFPKPIVGEADYDTDVLKNIHNMIGITPDMPGYGTDWGSKSDAAFMEWQKINQPDKYASNTAKGSFSLFPPDTKNTTKQSGDAVTEFFGSETSPSFQKASGLTKEGYKYNPQPIDTSALQPSQEDFVEPTGVLAGMEAYYANANKVSGKSATGTKSGVDNSNSESGGMSFTTGDVTGLLGNAVSMFAPMNNTLKNRASDTVNKNMYEDYGDDALATNADAQNLLAGNHDNDLQRVTRSANGAKRQGRKSATSINTMRATDLAVDINSNDANANLSDQYAKQMMAMLGQKSSLQASIGQVKAAGATAADLANRQDKDAFYTQLGKDKATIGQGLQQTGKDLNQLAQNETMMNMVNQMSKYFKFDKNNKIIAVNKQTKK